MCLTASLAGSATSDIGNNGTLGYDSSNNSYIDSDEEEEEDEYEYF